MMRLPKRLVCMAMILLCGAASADPGSKPAPATAQGTAVRSFSPLSYNADRQNWAIVEDNRGILFFGNSKGVLEFDGIHWRTISMPQNGGAYALGKAADGRILVGGEGEIGLLAPDSDGSMQYVSRTAELPDAFRTMNDRVIQILDTPIGQVYVSDHWLFVRPASGPITAVQSDDHFMQAAWFEGALYVLDSARGFTRLNGNALQSIAGGANLRGLTMVPTEAGLLIPSFNDGLIRYTPAPGAGKAWQVLNASGWSSTDGADVTSAVTLTPDLIALGTGRRGVLLINAEGGVLQHIDTTDGLSDAHIYSLNFDHRGGLWLAQDNGVSLVTLSLPADPAAVPFHAWVRSVVGTRDEKLLFGGTCFASSGGLQQLTQSAAQVLTFPFKYNAFRFEYSANGLDASNNMQFQTYLEGVDTGWSIWSSRSEREFTQLAAGTWVFRVRSRRADGAVSSEGTYTLKIEPAWYDTWWFTLFQIGFVVAILLLPGHAHRFKGVQEALTTFAVIVPIIYLGNWLAVFADHYYTSDVPFVKMLISASLAFLLDPIQSFLKKKVEHRNERRRERAMARLHKKKALLEQEHEKEVQLVEEYREEKRQIEEQLKTEPGQDQGLEAEEQKEELLIEEHLQREQEIEQELKEEQQAEELIRQKQADAEAEAEHSSD